MCVAYTSVFYYCLKKPNHKTDYQLIKKEAVKTMYVATCNKYAYTSVFTSDKGTETNFFVVSISNLRWWSWPWSRDGADNFYHFCYFLLLL